MPFVKPTENGLNGAKRWNVWNVGTV